MAEPGEKAVVSVLSESAWDARLAAARAELPFARRHWLALGLADSPQLRLVPTAVRWGQSDEVLVPLCVSGRRAQIGCYGYGSLAGPAARRGEPVDFADLAEAVCRDQGLAELTTLLPPEGAFPGLDRQSGHWPTRPGRDTYLLDLGEGARVVWQAARGSCRTAVRRAGALGLVASAAVPGHEDELLRLHRQTLARHDVESALSAPDLAFLVGGDHAVTTVVADDDGLHAASVFAVGAAGAFHIMQLTSERGRAANAGHLAFWSAVTELAERGVRTVDLGAATGEGHARFKTGWGAVAAAARVVHWRNGEAR
ncbi:hypothetical protein SGFS_036690 [Streptomyces graminofaciens]|uniref:BioF2-like acetyltransferase domain-containing protein n=1 Tax=Streptomyces graminofaciens TaxID=68212 RepID=A0ABN5VIG3_9ACTN|nr:GNAT family N-acetyltransferase [Streptomyces graminofaciens]BBC32375.1 hypothetical protein SGFS_036690 [Streptomyces graminofaciens]